MAKTRTALVVLTIVGAGCGLNVVGASNPDEAGAGVEATTNDAGAGANAPSGTGSVDGETGSQAPTGPTVDAGAKDPGANDAGDGAGVDAGPHPPVFGEECPPGTVYEDDFSFDPAGRWFPVAATWTWDPTNKIYTVTGFNPHGVTWIGPRPKWRNYSVDASIRISPVSGLDANAGPVFRVVDVGVPPIENNDGHMYLAAVVLNGRDDVIFGIEDDGDWIQRAQRNNTTIPTNQWITMRVEAVGEAIRVYLEGTKVIETSEDEYDSGSIGFKTYRLDLSIRSVKVTCL